MPFLRAALAGVGVTFAGVFVMDVIFNGIVEAVDNLRNIDVEYVETIGALAVIGGAAGAVGAVIA